MSKLTPQLSRLRAWMYNRGRRGTLNDGESAGKGGPWGRSPKGQSTVHLYLNIRRADEVRIRQHTSGEMKEEVDKEIT